MRRAVNTKILRMTEAAMLLALVVVLQLFGGFFKIGPFSLSFVLVPIVIGSIVLGYKYGAALGAAFGFVVVVQCATGVDAGGFILWGLNPVLTALICVLKGAAAGLVPGLIFRAITKKSGTDKKTITATVIAAVSAPVVNTGIFLLGLSCFFYDTLVSWANGANILLYIITGLVGINFVIEFIINLVVSPAISTIIRALNLKNER